MAFTIFFSNDINHLLFQENVGGTTYFYPTAGNHSANQTNSSIVSETSISLSHHNNSQDINYTQSTVHVYPGPPANVVNMKPRTQLSSAIFVPDEMRNEILSRNEIANLVDSTPNPGNLNLFAAKDKARIGYVVSFVINIQRKRALKETFHKDSGFS